MGLETRAAQYVKMDWCGDNKTLDAAGRSEGTMLSIFVPGGGAVGGLLPGKFHGRRAGVLP